MTPGTGYPKVTFFIESGNVGAEIAYGYSVIRGYGVTPWDALTALAAKVSAMTDQNKRDVFGEVLDTLERVGVKLAFSAPA